MNSANFFSGSLSGMPNLQETLKIDVATYDKCRKFFLTYDQHHDMSKICLQLSQLRPIPQATINLYFHMYKFIPTKKQGMYIIPQAKIKFIVLSDIIIWSLDFSAQKLR